MDDLICVGFFLIVVMAVIVLYRRSFSQGYWDRENDPIFLDARDDESKIIEAASICEQRKHGRERGGRLVLQISHNPPSDYSAQLNLRTLRKRQEKGENIEIV